MDDNFENIKVICDKNSFIETVLELNKKSTKRWEISGSTKTYIKKKKNTTTSRNDGRDQN